MGLTMTATQGDIFLIVFFLAAIMIVGIGFIIYPVLKMKLSADARDWPSVEGKVTGSYVRESDVRGSGLLPRYELAVKFEYEINGEKRIGSRVGVSRTKYETFVKYLMDELAESFFEGKAVKVFYHPEKHDLSVLDYEITNWQKIKYIFSILFGFTLMISSILLMNSYL
jgi:hypothetical protein